MILGLSNNKNMKRISILMLFAFIISNLFSQDSWEELAKTPPMGWNSWNTFALDINEDVIKGIADVFVESGLKDAGYEYIVIDDGWQMSRDGKGNIIADSSKFPSALFET